MSKKYNNADSTLAGDLQASGLSFVVKTGEGALFPTTSDAPYKMTHEHYEGSVVTKREILTISARSGDAFTVSARASETCVQDDSADPKTRTANALSFSSGDRVYLTINEDDWNDMQDEIYTNIPADIETAKADLKKEIQKSQIIYGASSTGNDDYAITLDPVPTAYNAGFTVKFLADVANTSSATLNVNSLGAKTIKKQNDNDLETGDIEANQIVEVVYNATDDVFEMTSQVASVVSVEVEASQTSVTAGENLSAGDAVYISASDGYAYKCDASNTSKIDFFGFVSAASTTGNPVTINTSGVDSNQSSLTINDDYFLSEPLAEENYNQTTGTSSGLFDTDTYSKFGQEFTPSMSGELTSFTYNIRDDGTTPANMNCKIYLASDRTTLIGTATNELTAADVTTTFSNFAFNFSGVKLQAGVKYVAVVDQGSTSSNNYQYSFTSSNVYSGGQPIYWNGSSWSTYSGDMYFRYTMTNNGTGAGTIRNEVGTNAVRVGKAASTTKIEIQNNRDDALDGSTGTTATTGGVTLGNAEGYVTIKINGEEKKIPYYGV